MSVGSHNTLSRGAAAEEEEEMGLLKANTVSEARNTRITNGLFTTFFFYHFW